MPKSKIRILLSNDDGVHAPGLKVLEKIAREISDDIWVVAPEAEQSGAAHSVTLTRPLRLRKISNRRYAVDGTPTDCMVLAILKLLKDRKPTLMLSGVNHGSNLGEDISYSGTVAAAMEATLLGIPAIAFSQSRGSGHPIRWGTAEHYGPDIIRRLLTFDWPKNVLLNVNFPNVVKDSVKGICVVRHGFRTPGSGLHEWFDPLGQPYYWLLSALRDERFEETGTDLSSIRDGLITVTPLHLDLTDYDSLESVKKCFK
jgi:5'-nucleotidase